MRTDIEIDDALMAEALAASGASTKQEVVEAGLRAIVDRQRQLEAIRSLRASVPDWTGDLDAMRTDR